MTKRGKLHGRFVIGKLGAKTRQIAYEGLHRYLTFKIASGESFEVLIYNLK